MNLELLNPIKEYTLAFKISFRHIELPYNQDEEEPDYGLRTVFDKNYSWSTRLEHLYQLLRPNEVTFYKDFFGITYLLFSTELENSFYLIGPYQFSGSKDDKFSFLRENLGEDFLPLLEQYYTCIPSVNKTVIYNGLITLLSLLFETNNLIVHRKYEENPIPTSLQKASIIQDTWNKDKMIQMLEQRYKYENEIMEAVFQGNERAAIKAWTKFSTYDLGPRFNGATKKKKNGLIIFNTLLRKAAEKASIHPFYLDEISTKYSYHIEALSSESEYDNLRTDMILGYCQYVNNHSLSPYSPLLQNIINYINLNLEGPLSLKNIADHFHMNPSYLSSYFSNEMSQTLTEYINTKRIHRASIQLIQTNLSIATIASNVGILDVNYFSKVFKKIMFMSPTKYRLEQSESKNRIFDWRNPL